MPPKKKSKTSSKKSKKEEVVEEVEESEEEDEADDEDRGRGKRKRRDAKSYEPDDFTMASANAASKMASVAKGRGTKLGDIEAFEKNLKKYKLNSDEFVNAYKFLFSNRGLSNKKLMKDKMLEFSGYLPPLPKGRYDKKKLDDDDEVIEVSIRVVVYIAGHISFILQIFWVLEKLCVHFADQIRNQSFQDDYQPNQGNVQLLLY